VLSLWGEDSIEQLGKSMTFESRVTCAYFGQARAALTKAKTPSHAELYTARATFVFPTNPSESLRYQLLSSGIQYVREAYRELQPTLSS